MYDIRPYRPEDRLSCLSVFKSNLPTYFATHEYAMFEAFLDKDHIKDPYYVLEQEGLLLTCGGYSIQDEGIAYLGWGMVHNEHHHQGYGTALLQWRLNQLTAHPYAWCILIDTSQHTAPFFARFGFREIRRIIDGYQQGLDKVYMRLDCSNDQ